MFLVGQHMLQYAMTGKPPAPMPARESPWAIYDVFTVRDGEQIFLAAVSDAQWVTFCDALGYADLKADRSLAANNDRVRARPTLLPLLRDRLASQRGRARRAVRARGTAVRADPQARGPLRRSAPRGDRGPRRRPAAGWRCGRQDRQDGAVPDHDGRQPARRAIGPAEAGRAHAGGARVAGILRRRDRPAVRATRRGLRRRPRTTTPWRRRR